MQSLNLHLNTSSCFSFTASLLFIRWYWQNCAGKFRREAFRTNKTSFDSHVYIFLMQKVMSSQNNKLLQHHGNASTWFCLVANDIQTVDSKILLTRHSFYCICDISITGMLLTFDYPLTLNFYVLVLRPQPSRFPMLLCGRVHVGDYSRFCPSSSTEQQLLVWWRPINGYWLSKSRE